MVEELKAMPSHGDYLNRIRAGLRSPRTMAAGEPAS
jgi:hypothetical protein